MFTCQINFKSCLLWKKKCLRLVDSGSVGIPNVWDAMENTVVCMDSMGFVSYVYEPDELQYIQCFCAVLWWTNTVNIIPNVAVFCGDKLQWYTNRAWALIQIKIKNGFILVVSHLLILNNFDIRGPFHSSIWLWAMSVINNLNQIPKSQNPNLLTVKDLSCFECMWSSLSLLESTPKIQTHLINLNLLESINTFSTLQCMILCDPKKCEPLYKRSVQ